MEAELCPLDDRRSAAEVSLKLAIVHFTTITAYCHLLSLRAEPARVICIKTVLFLMCPGLIIIQHILAILAIVGAYILVRFSKLQDPTPLQSTLRRAPVILLGRIDPCPPKSRLHSSNGDSVIKTIGRVTVVLAVTAQCIGSCIIFVRRQEHGAITLADWRVLELATASLLVSLLTVVYLLWQPRLRLSPKDALDLSYSIRRTYLEGALLYLRDVPATTDSGLPQGTDFLWDFPRFVLGSTIAFVLYCVQPWTARLARASWKPLVLSGGMFRELRQFSSGEAGCDGCATGFISNCIASLFQTGFLGFSLALPAIILRAEGGNTHVIKCLGIRPRQAFLRRLAVIPIGLVTWGLVVHTLFLSMPILSPLWNIYIFISQMVDSAGQLRMLATWPTSVECPLLWSDPEANFLWHLM